MKGFAPNLTFITRRKATWKWLIVSLTTKCDHISSVLYDR